jgi:flagellar hook-length control protein FliK
VGVDPEHAAPAPGTATSVAEPAAEVETILNHRELSLLADRAPVDPDTAPVPASAVPERTPHGFLRAESGDRTTPGAADARAASVATTGTPGDQTSTTAGGGSDGEPAHPGRSGQPQPAASVDQPASTQAAPAAAPVTGTGPIGRELVGRPPAELPARARLGELADVAATVIRLAARDGKAAARITLRPAELGEVEIRLRYHAGGISADVVAESSQAAQTLSQAAGELRRSLESQGLVVHWLDVRTGDEGRRAWQEGWHPGRGGARGHDHLDDPPEGLTAIEAAALPAASGSVDVLA